MGSQRCGDLKLACMLKSDDNGSHKAIWLGSGPAPRLPNRDVHLELAA